MISTVLTDTLEAIIPESYLLAANKDVDAPFCVHREKSVPQVLKSGVAGWVYTVEIAIADTTAEAVETYGQSIRTALEALIDTTVSGTTIEGVTLEGDAPDFDDESNLHVNVFTYTIETKNR